MKIFQLISLGAGEAVDHQKLSDAVWTETPAALDVRSAVADASSANKQVLVASATVHDQDVDWIATRAYREEDAGKGLVKLFRGVSISDLHTEPPTL